jgi:hypothetical protein
MIQELTVDLRLPPNDRWNLTPAQCEQARELLRQYQSDLGLTPETGEFLAGIARDLVPQAHWEEMEALARRVSLSVGEVALCNLYYDALKVVLGRVFGCTAFAVDTPEGVLHARNLDWWTADFGIDSPSFSMPPPSKKGAFSCPKNGAHYRARALLCRFVSRGTFRVSGTGSWQQFVRGAGLQGSFLENEIPGHRSRIGLTTPEKRD